MTSMELMELLSFVKDGYVADVYKPKKRVSYRRAALIAAAVILALALVGCAVAYVLSLERLKIGEPVTWGSGDEKCTYQLISLQGVNQEALTEWSEFRDSYDPDRKIALENESSGTQIPKEYRQAYGCYSQEMVERLEALVKKYDLKLLGPITDCQAWECQVLFDALSIGPLWDGEAEYLGGYFYQNGTFDVDAMVKGTWEGVESGEVLVGIRGSRKAYFDPVPGSIAEIDAYRQWSYTRRDGKQVLIAKAGADGRIFADLPDIFLAAHVVGADCELPESFLEDLAERINLSVQPKEADLQQVAQALAQADEAHEKQVAEDRAARERELYSGGYKDYVNRVLTAEMGERFGRDKFTYTLYDVNGDGTEELIINWFGTLYDIVTLQDGSLTPISLPYVPFICHFYSCEGNEIELYDDIFGGCWRFYFQAGAAEATFLFGLCQELDGTWTYYPEVLDGDRDPQTWLRQTISQAEAEKLIAAHPRVQAELSWYPLEQFDAQPAE